jgi:hypothetical protein
MKYCTEGMIEIVVKFESVTADQKYLILFDFTFTKNSAYNEEPLLNLLNSFAKSQTSFEEVLLKNYEDLFDLIQQFGIGMFIFPTVINYLQGSYSIQSLE